MKRSPRTRLVAFSVAAVAAATFLAACGDDDDAVTTTVPAASTEGGSAPTGSSSSDTTPGAGSASDNKDDYTNALADNLDLADRDMGVCISAAVVDEIGFDAIKASGLSPAEFVSGEQLEAKGLTLEPSQADHLQAAFASCGDIAEAFISAEEGPDAQKACERGIITNDLAAAFLATQLTGSTPSEEIVAAQQAASACVSTSSTAVTTTG
jgi:hypothetical protein